MKRLVKFIETKRTFASKKLSKVYQSQASDLAAENLKGTVILPVRHRDWSSGET